MARRPSALKSSNSIEYTTGLPADARTVVATKADLTAAGSFPYPYKGMPVAVQDEGSLYLYIGDDPTDDASWRKIGEDGSVELTQAEYDALSDAEKKNGIVYYVTDAPSSSGTNTGDALMPKTDPNDPDVTVVDFVLGLESRIQSLETLLAEYSDKVVKLTDLNDAAVNGTILMKDPPPTNMFELKGGGYTADGKRLMPWEDIMALGTIMDGSGTYYVLGADASMIPQEVKGIVIPGVDEGYAEMQFFGFKNAVSDQFNWLVAKDCMGVGNPLFNVSDAVKDKIYYRGNDRDAPWGQWADIDTVGNIPW